MENEKNLLEEGMLKNISSTVDISNLEYWSKVIKQRNLFIKSGKYSIVDGEMHVYGDCVVVGNNHEDAGRYLEDCLASCMNSEEAIDFQKDTENIYSVQIWHTTEINIQEIKNL